MIHTDESSKKKLTKMKKNITSGKKINNMNKKHLLLLWKNKKLKLKCLIMQTLLPRRITLHPGLKKENFIILERCNKEELLVI